MPAEVRSRRDALLLVPEEETLSTFELLKVDAANAGIENLGNEITKRRLLRSVGLPMEACAVRGFRGGGSNLARDPPEPHYFSPYTAR
jgi:hypothetical protein